MSRGAERPEAGLLWRVLRGQFWNLVLLNLLTLLLCLLLIPAPLALRALSRAEVELLRGEDRAPLGAYLRELRCEAWQTLCIGLGLLLLTGLSLWVSAFYLGMMRENGWNAALLALQLVLTAELISAQLWLYLLLAFSDAPLSKRLHNALLLPLVRPLRSLILVGLGVLLIALGRYWFPYSAFLVVLILPALWWLAVCWTLWPSLLCLVFRQAERPMRFREPGEERAEE